MSLQESSGPTQRTRLTRTLHISTYEFLYKDRVYTNKPQTIPELNSAITAQVQTVAVEECAVVLDNFVGRVQLCLRRGGAHLEHGSKRSWILHHSVLPCTFADEFSHECSEHGCYSVSNQIFTYFILYFIKYQILPPR